MDPPFQVNFQVLTSKVLRWIKATNLHHYHQAFTLACNQSSFVLFSIVLAWRVCFERVGISKLSTLRLITWIFFRSPNHPKLAESWRFLEIASFYPDFLEFFLTLPQSTKKFMTNFAQKITKSFSPWLHLDFRGYAGYPAIGCLSRNVAALTHFREKKMVSVGKFLSFR